MTYEKACQASALVQTRHYIEKQIILLKSEEADELVITTWQDRLSNIIKEIDML